MVLRYTSTSLGTLVRSMVATVRAGAVKPLEKANRLKYVVARTIESAAATSASHSQPFHRVSQRLQVVQSHARHFSTAKSTARAANYGNTSQTFQRAGYRPSARMPRGPAVPATVGLGKARTFATAPAHGSFQSGANNVPVVLRAFAQIFDDDDLPSPTRYAPYVRRPTRKAAPAPRGLRARRNRRTSSASITSATSSVLRELGHYFPVVLPLVSVDEETVVLPPQPERLVTPGVTTTLALPLSPSLNSLLEPNAQVPYADAEIGVGVLARLTHGIMPLHEAYAAAGARLILLLAHLEALGVLDIHAYPTTTLDVAVDYRGEPDILRIVFSGRSLADVRALLDHGDDSWYVLSQARQAIVPIEDEDEARVEWGKRAGRGNLVASAVSSASTASVDLALVMPTLDLSMAPTVSPADYDTESAYDYTSQSSWPPSRGTSVRSSPSESGLSTPCSFDGESWASSATFSSPASLLSSISSLDEYERDRSIRDWITPPSAADADLDAWSDAGLDHHEHGDEVQEVEMFWVGGGLSLTQSW